MLHANMDVQCLESQEISQMYLLEAISTCWLLQLQQKAMLLPMLCLDLLMLLSFTISLQNKW
jgi:hypothetical protein